MRSVDEIERELDAVQTQSHRLVESLSKLHVQELGLQAELSDVYLEQHGLADAEYLIVSREYIEWYEAANNDKSAVREGEWLKIDEANSTHIYTTPDGRSYRVMVPVELAKTMNKVLLQVEDNA